MYIHTFTDLNIKKVPQGVQRAPRAEDTTLPPGRYKLIEIPNPLFNGARWLCIEGQEIGAAQGFWIEKIRRGEVIQDPTFVKILSFKLHRFALYVREKCALL